MKVAVINYSGNVGKTTVAAHLLKPRLKEARLVSVESINSDSAANGYSPDVMTGNRFGRLQEILIENESVVVDVGASNVEDFLKLMQRYAGSHEEFDYFLVPVVAERKQQADSVNTIRALAQVGVEPARVRTIFNAVDSLESVEEDFAPLFGFQQLSNQFVLNPKAVIHTNEIFDMLRSASKSLEAVLVDTTDYRAKLRASTDEDERTHCLRMIALKRLAITANKNLDDVFVAVFSG